jgi:Ca2+-binding EF-hand superfamily protein
MKKTTLLGATFLITLASTAVIAIAKGGPDHARGGERGAAMERMFEELDTNADGELTRAEIEAAAATRFGEADADGNGQLTAEEMLAAREARDSTRLTRRIEARIERLDANGDGALSLEEMTASSERIDRMFERIDSNEDGVITKAEAEEMRSRHGRTRKN